MSVAETDSNMFVSVLFCGIATFIVFHFRSNLRMQLVHHNGGNFRRRQVCNRSIHSRNNIDYRDSGPHIVGTRK